MTYYRVTFETEDGTSHEMPGLFASRFLASRVADAMLYTYRDGLRVNRVSISEIAP